MLIISHRANIDGPDASIENKPEAIEFLINKKVSVEVDLRIYNDSPYFGHDEAQYKTSLDFLKENEGWLWVHCKDREAFAFALQHNFNCFWHNIDDYTITNHGYVWAYPGKESVGQMSIAVMPELFWKKEEVMSKNFFGVCTDYPTAYLDIINRV
jgi:hypothetical protein